MQPGPELDSLVAEKVMGWKPYIAVGTFLDSKGRIVNTAASSGKCIWHPSSRIDHAWEVVEHIISKGGTVVITNCTAHGGEWCADVLINDDIGAIAISGKTAPHAICMAALMAVGIDC